MSITPHKQDFVGEFTKVNEKITGVSTTAKVEGEGAVIWNFMMITEYYRESK